jgi:hypothetical protein
VVAVFRYFRLASDNMVDSVSLLRRW